MEFTPEMELKRIKDMIDIDEDNVFKDPIIYINDLQRNKKQSELNFKFVHSALEYVHSCLGLKVGTWQNRRDTVVSAFKTCSMIEMADNHMFDIDGLAMLVEKGDLIVVINKNERSKHDV